MITTDALIALDIEVHKSCVAIMDAKDGMKRTDPEYKELSQAQASVFRAVDILNTLMQARPDCDDWVMDFPNGRAKKVA